MNGQTGRAAVDVSVCLLQFSHAFLALCLLI